MNTFYEGFIACGGLLGGICAFIYWMFSITEKRLEGKIDSLSCEVGKIALELREERRARDAIYSFILDHHKKGK